MNVQLPDNSIVQFPDGMPDADVNAAINQYLGTQQIPQQPTMGYGEQAARQLGLAGRYIEGAAPLAIASLGDAVNGGINTATSALNQYAGTSIPQLGKPSDTVEQGLTAMGFPEPQGDMEQGVGVASKIAAGLMAGGEGTVNTGKEALANAIDMFSKPNVPVTSDAAKAIASTLYDRADQIGGQLSPEFTNDLIAKTAKLAPQTLGGTLTSGDSPLTALVDRWTNGNPAKGIIPLANQPLSLQTVQEMDEGLGGLVDNEVKPNGSLTKYGNQLHDVQTNFRNMIMDASPEDVIGGKEGFDALSDARQAYSQAMKMQDIEKIQLRASQSDNPATAIKSGVRTLISNPARTRGYSDDEMDALNAAGDRGALGSTLHVFGSRLVPFMGTVLGEHAGGLPGAMLGSIIGQGGSTLLRNAATSLQSAKLGNVLQTMGQNVRGQ